MKTTKLFARLFAVVGLLMFFSSESMATTQSNYKFFSIFKQFIIMFFSTLQIIFDLRKLMILGLIVLPPSLSAGTLSITDVTIVEGNSGITQAKVTFSGGTNPKGGEVVKLETIDGTAIANGDYTATTKNVILVRNDKTNTNYFIEIPIVGDTAVEPNETFQVKLTVTTGSDAYSTANAAVYATVTITNDDVATQSPPTFTGTILAQTATQGVAYSLNASTYFTATDGDAITYSASGLPTGITINTTTGVLSETPTVAGTFNVTITGTDNDGGTNSNTFTITVNAQSTNPEVPEDNNLYSCGLFASVLTTYNHLSFEEANTAGLLVCGTTSIAYPEGEVTGTRSRDEIIECNTAEECDSATQATCGRTNPPANRLEYDWTYPTDQNTFPNGGTLTELVYGSNLALTNNVTFTAPLVNGVKYMFIGNIGNGNSPVDLTFSAGDYYIESITGRSNKALNFKTDGSGSVRIFVRGDVLIPSNNAGINGTGLPEEMFIYIKGNFDMSSSGGGATAGINAYIYVEGEATISPNSANLELSGGITSEGPLNIEGNNGHFVQVDDGAGFGYGACRLCFERPSGIASTVNTTITNKGGITLTDLNISKVYSDSFIHNASSITSVNVGATSAYDFSIPLELDGLDFFPNPSTKNGYFYQIGDYIATQQDTLSDTTNLEFVLDDYNTSRLNTLKALYLAEYMDADRYYNVMVERCSEWYSSTYLTGPYDAWDIFRGDTIGNDSIIDDKNISTKIQNQPFDLTIASLDETNTMLETKTVDSNVTYGLYDSTGLISNLAQLDVSTQSSLTTTYTIDKSSPEVYVGFKFCASYDGSVFTLSDDSACTGSVHSCKANTNTPEWHLCYSSDSFAIRPESFAITAPNGVDIELLSSGVDYNFTMMAVDYNGATATDYNQTSNNLTPTQSLLLNDGSIDTNGILQGTIPPITNVFSFVQGVSNSVDISFNDVGKVTIGIQDQNWSIVDQDDTPQNCDGGVFNQLTVPNGAYTCGEVNATFIPDHFRLTNLILANSLSTRPFTYISSDLNMSATITVQIQAENANDSVTQNFTGGSAGLAYENPLSLTLTVPTLDKDGNTISSVDGTALVSSKQDITTPSFLNFTNGTRTLVWNETNTSQRLMFNYNKVINVPVNPIDINFSTTPVANQQLNLALASTYTAPTSGMTATLNDDANATGDARFFFARAKASKDYYDGVTQSNINTPISVLVYCDLWVGCSTLGIDTVNGQTNESYWWLSTNHSETMGDGNITLAFAATITEGAGTATVTTDVTIMPPNGQDTNIIVTSGATSLPMTAEIFLNTTGTTNTNTWLIYNPDSPIADPDPFYKVRFIDTAGWSGVGNTGYVLDTNASNKKTKRLNW